MGWHYPYRTYARRRVNENPEENDWSLTPIADTEAYRLQDRVKTSVFVLSDMGIYAITNWSLKARCYMHGWQSRDVISTDLVPRQPRIKCHSCDRDLVITARVKEGGWEPGTAASSDV